MHVTSALGKRCTVPGHSTTNAGQSCMGLAAVKGMMGGALPPRGGPGGGRAAEPAPAQGDAAGVRPRATGWGGAGAGGGRS